MAKKKGNTDSLRKYWVAKGRRQTASSTRLEKLAKSGNPLSPLMQRTLQSKNIPIQAAPFGQRTLSNLSALGKLLLGVEQANPVVERIKGMGGKGFTSEAARGHIGSLMGALPKGAGKGSYVGTKTLASIGKMGKLASLGSGAAGVVGLLMAMGLMNKRTQGRMEDMQLDAVMRQAEGAGQERYMQEMGPAIDALLQQNREAYLGQLAGYGTGGISQGEMVI